MKLEFDKNEIEWSLKNDEMALPNTAEIWSKSNFKKL